MMMIMINTYMKILLVSRIIGVPIKRRACTLLVSFWLHLWAFPIIITITIIFITIIIVIIILITTVIIITIIIATSSWSSSSFGKL